jgi:hypothetical protein
MSNDTYTIKFTRAEIGALADAVDYQVAATAGDAEHDPDAARVLEILITVRDRFEHALFETSGNYQRINLTPECANELRVAGEVSFAAHRRPRTRAESDLARSLERALGRLAGGATVTATDLDAVRSLYR